LFQGHGASFASVPPETTAKCISLKGESVAMFGKLSCTLFLRIKSEDAGLDRAVARLVEITDCGLDDRVEHPQVARWIQFPRTLLILQIVPDDPESGEIFYYRRKSTWFLIDFEDRNDSGFTHSSSFLLNARHPQAR
jgi:hypothetical protein